MKTNIEKLKLIPESEYNRLNERIRQLESILKNIETIHVADTVVKMSSLRGENERLKRSVEHYKELKTKYKHQMKENEKACQKYKKEIEKYKFLNDFVACAYIQTIKKQNKPFGNIINEIYNEIMNQEDKTNE